MSELMAAHRGRESGPEVAEVLRPRYDAIARRMKMGKELRERVPRSAHAEWEPPSDRPDPVDVLLETGRDRLPELLPIRHGRMMVSPLSYLRGAAAMMAHDLSSTPDTGLQVQACGDCHLGNFGIYATPERRLVFDINDFDETAPGPWEWDLKRLAASIYVSGKGSGMSDKVCAGLVRTCSSFYRQFMLYLAKINVMDMWYFQFDLDTLITRAKDEEGREIIKGYARNARRKVTARALPRLTKVEDGHRRFIDQPPLIYHLPDGQFLPETKEILQRYRQSLEPYRRALFDRYHFEDFAMKVVGVGSVGTRCGIILLLAEAEDPMILQVKEATRSVLGPYSSKCGFEHHGQRVVEGQRLIQTSSDIMLGWFTMGSRDYYVRQLTDMKEAFDYEGASPDRLSRYARLCAMALAKAHARSGDAAMIAGYLGKGDAFDQALASFAASYARQNLQDYEVLAEAVRVGRVEAVQGR